MRAIPQLNLRPATLARAVAAAVALTLAGGLVWALAFRLGILFLLIVAGAGIGYFIAERISRAAGRRTSPVLPYLAGVSAVLSLLVGNVMLYLFFTPLGFSFALRHAFSLGLWPIMAAFLAVGVAIGRLR